MYNEKGGQYGEHLPEHHVDQQSANHRIFPEVGACTDLLDAGRQPAGADVQHALTRPLLRFVRTGWHPASEIPAVRALNHIRRFTGDSTPFSFPQTPVRLLREWPEEEPFGEDNFSRMDESDDGSFYGVGLYKMISSITLDHSLLTRQWRRTGSALRVSHR